MRRLGLRTGLVAVAGVAVSVITTLGTVTQGDVVRHHDWIDPIEVKIPRVGQYYIVADDGTIEEPLCELEDDDLEPVAYPAEGRRYINWLGQVAPFVVNAAASSWRPRRLPPRAASRDRSRTRSSSSGSTTTMRRRRRCAG